MLHFPVNWCQHWFEYLSFPPVNILSLIENLLAEHDSILVSVFCDVGITSRQYAWTLLSSAFSEVSLHIKLVKSNKTSILFANPGLTIHFFNIFEVMNSLTCEYFLQVLTAAQWKQLWDHVISNPPWFLLFAVVAYNISCRASLKTCTSKKDFEVKILMTCKIILLCCRFVICFSMKHSSVFL